MLQGWRMFPCRLQKSIDEIESLFADQETLSDKDSDDELDPVPIEKADNKILCINWKTCKYYTSDMGNT